MLIDDLRRLVEPATLGSPVQPLRWISKSREKLARALKEMGHKISANTVAKLLTDVLGFSRQVNRKADEGSHHPDRNAQFECINAPRTADAELLRNRGIGHAALVELDDRRLSLSLRFSHRATSSRREAAKALAAIRRQSLG